MNTRRSRRSNFSSSSSNNTSCKATAASKVLTPELVAINAKICRLVAEHPCMYDHADPHYLKKSWMDSAWMQIAQALEDNVDLCKERWRNIRTSFARSINVKRVPNANRTKPYYLNEELEFLRPHITPGVRLPTRSRRSSNKARHSYDDEADDDKADDDNTDETRLATMYFKQSPYAESSSLESNHASLQLDAEPVADEQIQQLPELNMTLNRQLTKANAAEVAPLICPCPPKKRQRADTEISDVPDQDQSMPIAAVACLDASIANAPDYDDAFLRGLKPEMSSMTFQQKLHFKCRIYELLAEIFPAKEPNAGPIVANNACNEPLPEPTASNYAMQNLGGYIARPITLQLPKLIQKPRTREALD